MKTIFKRILSLLLVISLTSAMLYFPVSASDFTRLEATGAEVALDGANEASVTVSIVCKEYLEVYGIEGQWDLHEQENSEFFTLTSITSDVLTFKGMNFTDVSSGKVAWTDDNFEGLGVMDAGQKFLSATYTVAADTPAGEYTVCFRSDVYTDETEYYPDETETYYTAKIKVTRAAAHTCTLTHVAAKDATCDATGNIEYWFCSDAECGKYYSDAQGTEEITDKASVVTPVVDDAHNWGEPTIDKKSSTATQHKLISICGNEGTHTKVEWVDHEYDENGVCACEAIKTYTITWNVNSEITKATVQHGEMPAYIGTPDKGDTAEWDYTFAGWDPQVVPATTDAEYVAQFDAVKKSYTITWKVEGQDDVTTTVAYGETPVYPNAEPSKAATAEYSYIFAGWGEIKPVSGEATYTAKFTEAANTYSVIYKVDGVEVNRTPFAYGAAVTAWDGYTAPEGYNFSGWSVIPETMPAKDVVVEGTTTIKTYTITWKDDEGNTIDTTTVAHNAVPTHADAAKEATAQYTYTFSGWSPAVVAATRDMTYTAVFTPVIRSYPITFKVDGEIYKTVNVPYGENPSVADPTKNTDAHYSYTFAGWTPAVAEVKGEATYEATWTETPVEHTITFKINGEVFHIVKGGYNTPADYSKMPTTEKTGYTFTGWDSVLPDNIPGEDIVINGSYTVNSYKITYKVDGVVVHEDSLTYGANVSAWDYNASEGYIFSGWDYVPTTMPANDVVVTGTTTPASYTVTWIVDGEVYDTTTVKYGEVITAPNMPEKAGHTFNGWTGNPGTMPAENITITGSWTANEYTIIFMSGDEQVGTITAIYGTDITEQVAAMDVKANDYAPNGHKFNCWKVEDKCVTLKTMPKDMTVEASFTVNTYRVNFYASENDTTTFAHIEVDFGAEMNVEELLAQITEIPEKEGHTFDGWNTENLPDAMPAANVDVYGKWIVDSYTVTWVIDGVIYDIATVEYGASIDDLNAPEKAGYTFNGWTGNPGTMPAEDVTITGSWTVNNYTITFDVEGVANITAPYGSKIEWPAAPEKDDFVFQGWSVDGETVIKELPQTMPVDGLELKAVWASETVYITWIIDGNETVESYKYGDPITAPEPGKSADGEYTYKFIGWDKDIPATATANDTYTAKFEKDQAVKYTVKFVDGENVISESEAAWTDKVEEFTYNKTGYTVTWTVGGEEVSFPYQMTTTDITFVAKCTPKTYTITIDGEKYGEFSFGAELSIKEPTLKGNTFAGWLKDGVAYELPDTMPAENLEITSSWTVNKYTLKFEFVDAEGNWKTESVSVDFNADTAAHIPVPENWIDDQCLLNVFKAWSAEIPETMPANDVVVKAIYTKTGWLTDENGTTYVENDVKKYCGELAQIDGAQYWFDNNGYIVKDIVQIDDNYYAFDTESGKFLADFNGIYTAQNGELYYVESGIAVADKGLVRTVNTDGVVEYYYFGCTVNADTCPSNFQCDSYKAQKNRTHWLENTHDLLPVWDYSFDENGVIVHDDDTSKNGIDKDVNGVKCFYVDGIKVHKGLFVDNGKYYYARSSGELVVGREYWISESHMNGLTYKGAVIEEGIYKFDAEGAIVWPSEDKDGIYEENGKLYYYVDGVRTYAGLIEIDGDYYYVRTSGELAVGSYWVTKNNGLMKSATYQFGVDGKMIRTNGFVNEDGGIYYYVDGNRFYAGLIEIDGDYYYVRTSGQVATNTNYWISKTNGLMEEGSYEFGADGKMVLAAAQNGIVEVGGKLHYYVDGAPCYAGLIQYTGNLTKADGTVIMDAYQNAWIYVRTGGELAVNRPYWTTKHNDYMKAASYQFDANGVMLNPPV